MEFSDGEYLAAVSRWLPQQRWFAAKGRAVTDLRVVSRRPVAGVSGAEHLIIAAEIDGGQRQVYQLPVRFSATANGSVIGPVADGYLLDGLTDSDVVRAILTGAQGSPVLDPEGGQVRCHWLGRPPIGAYRALSAEQSNTSAVLGETVIVKFYRLLAPGINPDVEVHARLAEVGCTEVGRLFGWVSGGWRDARSGDPVAGHLAMIQEFHPDATDGWDLARASVAGFTGAARELGETTVHVHRDLARAFPTSVRTGDSIAGMVQRLQARLVVATRIVPGIGPLAAALGARIEAVGALCEVPVQRVHGDLHLGQTLRTHDGWLLLDFEGEPGTPLAGRRLLDHPMRDVAGMLRSFAYAAWQGGAGDAWRRDCCAAFVHGYAPAGLTPAEQILLDAYSVDKAAYEAVYEQRNRPDWIDIPMAALREIAAG